MNRKDKSKQNNFQRHLEGGTRQHFRSKDELLVLKERITNVRRENDTSAKLSTQTNGPS